MDARHAAVPRPRAPARALEPAAGNMWAAPTTRSCSSRRPASRRAKARCTRRSRVTVANNGAVVGSKCAGRQDRQRREPVVLGAGPRPDEHASVQLHADRRARAADGVDRRGPVRGARRRPRRHHSSGQCVDVSGPGVVATTRCVPFTPTGSEVAGRLLTADPALQRLAVENGFRTTKEPARACRLRPAEWRRSAGDPAAARSRSRPTTISRRSSPESTPRSSPR